MSDEPVKKIRNPTGFAVGTPEHTAELKRRAREAWAAKKHIYRPPEGNRSTADAPVLPKGLPLSWTVPGDLHEVLGETLMVGENWSTWPMFHVRRQSELSKTTMTQYKSYYYSLPQRDIFDVVRVIKTHNLAKQNMLAKAGLSYVCQNLYEMIYERQRKGLAGLAFYKGELLKMMVYAEMSKRTKRATYEAHSSQEATGERLESTVPWSDWEQLARRFVKALANKVDATERDKKEAIAAALYSMIPPVRLDWNDVEVRHTKGGKALDKVGGEPGKNIMWLAPKTAVVYWGEFKNAASFGGDLPLRQELPTSLVRILHKCIDADVVYPLKVPNFSNWLTGLAEQITGKAFSNRLMRSSFIRHYHEQNSREGVNVEATKAMMRLLHQTNMEVHLAYNKTHMAASQTE